MSNKFAYILDTSIKTVADNEWLLNYPVVIIECTFIFDGEEQIATNKKHIHWNQLKPFVLKYPGTQFILTHFSQRYSDYVVASFFEIVRRMGIINIYPWITDDIEKQICGSITDINSPWFSSTEVPSLAKFQEKYTNTKYELGLALLKEMADKK